MKTTRFTTAICLLRSSSLLAAFSASVLPLHATVTFLNSYTGSAAEVNSSNELAY